MAALTVQVKLTILIAVEVDAPPRQFLDLFRSHAYHLLNSLGVADEVASHHGVVDMLRKVV